MTDLPDFTRTAAALVAENDRVPTQREPVVVPHHEHITVDEETYWGLMYLHIEVKSLLREGKLADPTLKYLSNDAERRLQQSRRWNEADPYHVLPSDAAHMGQESA